MALRDGDAAGAIAVIVWQKEEEVAALSFREAKELLGARRSIPWPGGASLKGLKDDEATIVVARALIDVIESHRNALKRLGHPD